MKDQHFFWFAAIIVSVEIKQKWMRQTVGKRIGFCSDPTAVTESLRVFFSFYLLLFKKPGVSAPAVSPITLIDPSSARDLRFCLVFILCPCFFLLAIVSIQRHLFRYEPRHTEIQLFFFSFYKTGKNSWMTKNESHGTYVDCTSSTEVCMSGRPWKELDFIKWPLSLFRLLFSFAFRRFFKVLMMRVSSVWSLSFCLCFVFFRFFFF